MSPTAGPVRHRLTGWQALAEPVASGDDPELGVIGVGGHDMATSRKYRNVAAGSPGGAGR